MCRSSTITSRTISAGAKQITLGFPLAALLTLWVGPVLVPRLSPRKLILVGTGFDGWRFWASAPWAEALGWYYAFWFMYTMGYILAGPIPHQLIRSHWFRKSAARPWGSCMLESAVGASSGTLMVKPLTAMHELPYRADGHRAVDVPRLAAGALWCTRTSPRTWGSMPDGDAQPARRHQIAAAQLRYPAPQLSVLAAVDWQFLLHRLDRRDELPYEVRASRTRASRNQAAAATPILGRGHRHHHVVERHRARLHRGSGGQAST